MKFDKSIEMYNKTEGVIPSATQTFSKGPKQYPFGVSPIFLDQGKGSHVWDVDGNEFIDYPMALGAVILGHSYETVNQAIKKQCDNSTLHTLPHKLEGVLSEMLVDLIPCAQMVRFGKNGSDATAGAIRAARAYTKREKIACCGYHGWQDWFIGTTTRRLGVPQAVQDLTLTFEYNNIESLKSLFDNNKDQIAAVIMEPMGIERPKDDFLAKAKELAHENGAVLIFDEVVTGFRMNMGGAQSEFNVIPDLACFGKGLGNGMPISAIVGQRKIMKVFDDIFYSFTFGGECLSLASAIATINELKDKNALKHMALLGANIRDEYNALARELNMQNVTECKGYDAHNVITFNQVDSWDTLMIRTLFQQECIDRGILAIGVHNISYSHTEKDIDQTLKVYKEALLIIKDAIEHKSFDETIRGQIVEPVFRQP